MKIRIISFIVILASAVALCGCAGRKTATDVPVSQIAAKFDSNIMNSDKLSDAGDDYLEGMVGINKNLIEEYVLKIQTSGTQIDQYGIFKAADKDSAEKISVLLGDYISKLEKNWDAFNYLPEEQVKIKSAAVTSSGNYIFYTILSDDERTAVTGVFNSMIKK